MDVLFLIAVQGLPLPILVLLGAVARTSTLPAAARALAAVNGLLLGIHLLLLWPLSRSYEKPGATFWLSWLADPLAVARIVLSTVQRQRQWRGRRYARRP
jgi:dolichol-phosphate mannosyltransferase